MSKDFSATIGGKPWSIQAKDLGEAVEKAKAIAFVLGETPVDQTAKALYDVKEKV